MSNIRKKIIAVLAVLFCALLCVSAALFIPKTPKTADAAVNSNAVTLVTKNTSSGKFFDTTSLDTLFAKLTGNSNATYQTLDNMFTTGSEQYSGLDLFINAGNSVYDVVLDDKHWNPVYLSKEGDDIVLTLWLADVPDDLKTKGLMYAAFFSGASKPTGKYKYTSEMYSASILREYLVGEPYAISTTELHTGTSIQSSIWKNFIADYGNYIVAPKQVYWQSTERASASLFARSNGSGISRDFINEAASSAANENYPYDYGTQGCDYYYDWAKDALWVPTITETGTSYTADKHSHSWYGLWYPSSPKTVSGSITATQHNALVDAHLKNSKAEWLRDSGGYDLEYSSNRKDFFCYYIQANGVQSETFLYDSSNGIVFDNSTLYGIRPAFHFNLTKAYKTIPAPENVENVYSGTEQKLADLAQKPDWYTLYSDLYGNEDKLKVDYPTGDGDMLNASTNNGYEVKVTIVDKDSYLWPDTTNPKTDLERTFKFKITKKKVRVDLSPPTNNKVETGKFDDYPVAKYVDGEIAANDLPSGATNHPTLITKYKNKNTSEEFNSVDNKPIKPGHYTATAEIAGSVVNKNYEIITDDPTHPHTIDFDIVPHTVAKPTLSFNTDLKYNALAHKVDISSTEHLKYTVKKDGVVVTAEGNQKLENLTDTSFEVVNAGVYTVTFTIVDQYYAWSETLGSNGSMDNADYTPQSFEIKKKELTIKLDGRDNPDTVNFEDGEWGPNTSVKFKINVTGEEGDDKVILYVYYTDKDGNGEYPASKQQGTDYYVILGQTEKGDGYKLYCKLADPTVVANAVNGNYYIDYNGNPYVEKGFTISTAKAPFKESDLKWQYKYTDDDGNHTLDVPENGYITYNGHLLTVLLKNTYDDLKALGVKVDMSYGTNGYDGETSAEDARSAAYVVTVKIIAVNTDYAFEDKVFTFNWYIDQAEYDLESFQIEWSYRARGKETKYTSAGAQYEGGANAGENGYIEMFISGGLPDKLSVSLQGNRERLVSDSYTVTVTGFTNTNTNYKNIDDFSGLSWKTYPWKIIPRTLSTASSFWSVAQYENEKVTAGPELDILPYNSNILEYKYYETEDCSGTAFTLSQLSYTEGTSKTYYVKAFIVDSEKDNWILGSQNNPHSFEIGKSKEAVEITIDAGGEYDGTEKAATVGIVGTVDGIDVKCFDIVYYRDGSDISFVDAPKDAGSYRVVVSLKPEYSERYYIKGKNALNFEITKRVLEIPTSNVTVTYNGTEQNVAELCGLPDGWENYIEVSIVVLGGGSVSGNTVKTMGTYTVTFKIKDGINSGDIVNVEWNANAKTSNKTATVKVVQLVLNAKGWNEDGYYSTIDFEESNADKFVVYRVLDASGKVVDEGTVYSSVGEMFVVEVSVGEEHGDNVRIVFVSGVTARFEFFTDGGEDPVQVALPTIADLTFNGENQTFVVNYGGFEEYIEIDLSLSDASVLSQFNAGEYRICFKIKSGINAVWATGGRGSVEVTFKMKVLVLDEPQVKSGERFTYNGSEQSATLNIDAAILARFMKIEGNYKAKDAGDYSFTLSIDPSFAGNVAWASAQGIDAVKTVEWTIEKARVSVKWTQSGDVPELDIPEEFKDLDVEYEITDENGNVVSPDQMEPGKQYTVTAKIKEGSAANYEFVDDNGKTLANPASTGGLGFEFKGGGSSFPWWIIALIAVLLIATAAVIVIVVKKRQTADGDDFDDYYGDDYDYDDEFEEDDFDEDF